MGFVIPSWDDLIRERPNHGSVEEEDPSQPRYGRQQDVAAAVHKVFLEDEVRPVLDEPEEALLRSQGGPLASVPFTSLPTLRETTFAPQPFRLLLLRHPRFAVPLSARWCRCGRPLDCRGHHRSACSRAGILGYRGCPMVRKCATSTLVRLTIWPSAGDTPHEGLLKIKRRAQAMFVCRRRRPIPSHEH